MSRHTPANEPSLEAIAAQVGDGITLALRASLFKVLRDDYDYQSQQNDFDPSFFCFTVLHGSIEVRQKLSLALAGIIHQFSLLSEVKATPKALLAKEIREEIFSPLDEIVDQYLDACNAAEQGLEGIDTKRSAVEGAVAGKILGITRTRNIEAAFGALAAASHANESKRRIHSGLLDAGLLHLEHYIQKIPELHPLLADYILTKILGDQTNASLRNIADSKIEGLQPDFSSAMNLAGELRQRTDQIQQSRQHQEKSSAKRTAAWIIAVLLFIISFFTFFFSPTVGVLFLVGALAILYFTYLSDSPADNTQQQYVCDQCGAPAPLDAKFCAKRGVKFD
jgi:hypothetical protein